MARIELNNVDLIFRVRKRSARMTLKEYVVRGLFLRRDGDSMPVHALRNLNLDLRAGQRVGIIGHNGAGKSTLLRLLAGIYEPTRGKRLVDGRISSLFDLMVGFESDGTGWENIRYRGYLQGETPRSIKRKIKAIADFTELGEFLDMPVRYYSAGMLVRLGFAIATAIDPEILLIDEVLSVGDMSFQIRARQRLKEMIDRAQLLVVVSHDLNTVADLCNRGLWMDQGRLRMDGPMKDVIAAYIASVQQ